MRIGASLASAYPGAEAREGARWMIERARAARAAGLDSLFVGDHHATGSPYYQNTPMMGRLLAEWGDRPAGCLFLLPLWNPVLLAEQVGTLASIHEGRFIIQCALGAGRQQFEAVGAEIKTRPSAFEEALTMIRALLAGEKVSGTRRFATVKDASVSPLPSQPVEIWIGGSAEASIDRAARLGDAWLAGPELSTEQAARWIAFYRERCAEYGREAAAIAIRRDIFIGASDAEAEEKAGGMVKGGFRGFPPDAFITGGPETVATRFRELADLGYTDVIVRQMAVPQEAAIASYHRLGRLKESMGGKP
jgi:alkanesulfonate monooxygenase SsuD/methylene tetrahydromethanopterin reductase-like flavin-dependent oxidoreductase (luciferase family)